MPDKSMEDVVLMADKIIAMLLGEGLNFNEVMAVLGIVNATIQLNYQHSTDEDTGSIND